MDAAASDADGQAPASTTHEPATAAEQQYQFERVGQQIEYFSSVGHITDTEMGNLQTEIARLDQAGRREMLRKLTQALNSGAIEGRF